MPGYDGTGPGGTGPYGRGLGPCGQGTPRRGYGFFGFRRGRRGGGLGFGWPRRVVNDKDTLQEEKNWLQQRLDTINGQLNKSDQE